VAARTFILDSDGGVDDAQALLLLIANGRTPDLITTVFGNVEMESATRNLLAVLAVAGVSVPVHKGADRPLVQPVVHAKHVHGEDGLGGAKRPARTEHAASDDAVGVLRRTFREAAAQGGKADILMIGPLTNLALALRLEPGIIAGIGRLTIMGGTVYGRGNSTPAAEFNIYADPEAADVVLSAEIETVIVPWEPCMSHRIAGAEVDRLFAAAPASPLRDFQQALAKHARGGIVSRGHPDVMFYVDPLAAAVVIEPGIVTKSIEASVRVALAPGITRGMTVCDPSGRLGSPKHTFVEEVDIGRMDRLFAVSAALTPAQDFATT
jgi:purine nucleosidase/non-specific riboncleoside hydrolase